MAAYVVRARILTGRTRIANIPQGGQVAAGAAVATRTCSRQKWLTPGAIVSSCAISSAYALYRVGACTVGDASRRIWRQTAYRPKRGLRRLCAVSTPMATGELASRSSQSGSADRHDRTVRLANTGVNVGPFARAEVLIDSSAVKAHRCAAGGKGRNSARRSAARVADGRRKSMP